MVFPDGFRMPDRFQLCRERSLHLSEHRPEKPCVAFHRNTVELARIQGKETGRLGCITFLYGLAPPGSIVKARPGFRFRGIYLVFFSELPGKPFGCKARCDTTVKMGAAGSEKHISLFLSVTVRKLRKVLAHENRCYMVAPSGVRQDIDSGYIDGRGFVQQDKGRDFAGLVHQLGGDRYQKAAERCEGLRQRGTR